MTSIRLPEHINNKLEELASLTKRSKSFFIKEAINKYLEEMEDTYIALDRIANPKAKYLTSNDLLKKLE